jgi:NADPH:quinone reductase-like Zn-dependent oxidoreductase
MRAFVIKQLSHPSKVELTKDTPDPKPVPDRILVNVYSAGLNFYDVSMRSACPTNKISARSFGLMGI